MHRYEDIPIDTCILHTVCNSEPSDLNKTIKPKSNYLQISLNQVRKTASFDV